MNRNAIIFFILMSLLFGIWSGYIANEMLGTTALASSLIGTSGFLICMLFCWYAFSQGKRIWDWYNATMEDTSIEVLLGAILGMFTGVTVGYVLGYPFSVLKGGGEYIGVATFLIGGFLGTNIGRKRAYDILNLFPHGLSKQKIALLNGSDKVLDTSAIIDGRIYDVVLSGFLEGCLVVPTFVIEELRHIADSSDFVRRSKGRRGLEILNKIQKHPGIKIRIYEGDFPEEREVDMKLLRLCQEIKASIITNDYNLNKVAELKEIKVLNVNELTNAVKVIVFPGETMRVGIIKGGKEEGQGVGYLEDGTMVVVEGGEDDIGQELEVVVTSVFQTAAGRMIFTRKAREGARVNQMVQKLQEVNLFG